MPTLTLVGYSARLAAATNSVAVTVPSFTAFVTHLPTATFDWPIVIVTSIASVIGAWLGARFTAGRVKSATLSRIFAVAIDNIQCAQNRRGAPKDVALLRRFEPEQEVCRHRRLAPKCVVSEKRPHATEHAFHVFAKTVLPVANLRDALGDLFATDAGDVAAGKALEFRHHGMSFLRIRDARASQCTAIIFVGAR